MVPDGKDLAQRSVSALHSITSENMDPPRPTISGLNFSPYSSTRSAATSERTVCTPPNTTTAPPEGSEGLATPNYGVRDGHELTRQLVLEPGVIGHEAEVVVRPGHEPVDGHVAENDQRSHLHSLSQRCVGLYEAAFRVVLSTS